MSHFLTDDPVPDKTIWLRDTELLIAQDIFLRFYGFSLFRGTFADQKTSFNMAEQFSRNPAGLINDL